MWLKYRHKWASGPDREWTWAHLGYDPALQPEVFEDTLQEVRAQYRDEDHYRGIEHEVHPSPPKETLAAKVEALKVELAHTKRLLAQLEADLASIDPWENPTLRKTQGT